MAPSPPGGEGQKEADGVGDVHRLAEILKRLNTLEAWKQTHEERMAQLEIRVLPFVDKCSEKSTTSGFPSPLPLTPLGSKWVTSPALQQGDEPCIPNASPLRSPSQALEKLSPDGESVHFVPKAKRRPSALNAAAFTGLHTTKELRDPNQMPISPEPTTAAATDSTAGSEESTLADLEVPRSPGPLGLPALRLPVTPTRRQSPKVAESPSGWQPTPLSTVQEGACTEAVADDEREMVSSGSNSSGRDSVGDRSVHSLSRPPPPMHRPPSNGSGGSGVPVFTPEAPPVAWRAWKEMVEGRFSVEPEVEVKGVAPPSHAPALPSEPPIPPAPSGEADEARACHSLLNAFASAASEPASPGSAPSAVPAVPAVALPQAAQAAVHSYPPPPPPSRGNLLSTSPPNMPTSCLGVASTMPSPRPPVPSSQVRGPPAQVIAWYQGVFISGIEIRTQANVNAPRTGGIVRCGEVFGVSEIVPSSDQRFYLKLADGRGWVFDDTQILPEDPSVVRLPPAMCPPPGWHGQRLPTPHGPLPPGTSSAGSQPPVLSLAQALAVLP
mmetsp:Transcript_19005/g.34327  ORF Transcript_19005/g.34327 Transcript_19005/m.34327 type:complete len:553 (-) Transcript_19005:132-1790(-)